MSEPRHVGPGATLARTSLRVKVPLLVSGLLAGVLGAATWLGYTQFEETLLAAAGQRISVVASLLAGEIGRGGTASLVELRREAQALPYSGFPARPPADTALPRALLASVEDTPNLVSREIWTAGGACVVGAWRPMPVPEDSLATDRAVPRTGCAPGLPAPDPSLLRGGGGIGPLRFAQNRMYTEVSLPVGPAEGPDHYVIDRRVTTRQGVDLVSALIAPDARLRVGNAGSGIWWDFVSPAPGPTDGVGPGIREYTDSAGVTLVAGVASVPGTPWVIDVERERDRIVEPAFRFLVRSGFLAVIVLLVGVLVGLAASRRVIRPVLELTAAAEGMARGEFDRRVPMGRTDELGRLAWSFNVMAAEIAEGRHAMEMRVEERTAELRRALRNLEATQEELLRKERLAILGELAGGVGHEIRNPLGIMSNAVYYLERVLDDAPPKVRQYLGVLRSQIDVSEKITQDLMDVARTRRPVRQSFHLGTLAATALEDVEVPEGIEVVSELDTPVEPVWADPDQARQVVVNLLTNAVQAMEADGGTLSFRLRAHDDRAVVLEVGDTGPGVEAPDLNQVFKPLYTTKAKGIGLGLAVSRSLAESNGGALTLESEPGVRTTFFFTLPTRAGAAAAAGTGGDGEGAGEP